MLSWFCGLMLGVEFLQSACAVILVFGPFEYVINIIFMDLCIHSCLFADQFIGSCIHGVMWTLCSFSITLSVCLSLSVCLPPPPPLSLSLSLSVTPATL